MTTVNEFVTGEYLTHVTASLAPSTMAGYKKMWAAYARYFEGQGLELRCCDCQGIMRQIALDAPQLNKTTLGHIKNYFSGVWGHAIRMGVIASDANPWRNVAIPTAPEAGDTYAYSPEEVTLMRAKLATPYDVLVLLAACTGLRKSEIRGLRWADFDEASLTLSVNRSVWGSHIKTTKTKASKAPVPVVPALAARLRQYKSTVKCDGKSFMFANSTGGPMDLGNAASRFIVPAVGQLWHGWHAFRRGLATFLHAQGVDDKTIQAILRHENVAVTQKCYVKTIPESVRSAMASVTFGEGA